MPPRTRAEQRAEKAEAKEQGQASQQVQADPAVYALRSAFQMFISGLIAGVFRYVTGNELGTNETVILAGCVMSAVVYIQNRLEQSGKIDPMFKQKALDDDKQEKITQRMVTEQMEFLRQWYDEQHARGAPVSASATLGELRGRSELPGR